MFDFGTLRRIADTRTNLQAFDGGCGQGSSRYIFVFATRPFSRRQRSPNVMNTREEFERCAARLKAVADKDRLRIITMLLDGPKHVGVIATAMNVELAHASHHLGVLRKASIVVTVKKGRYIEYALHSDVYLPMANGAADRSLNLGECRLILSPRPTTHET